MKQILPLRYVSQSRNAEHYNLQEALLRAISADFAAKYKLTSLYNIYLSVFKEEDDIFLQSRKLVGTLELDNQDAMRDRFTRLLKVALESKLLGLSEEDAKVAQRITDAIEPNKNAASKPVAENTALVSDMVKKLQSDEYAADVAKLGLTEIVAKLKEVNDKYAVLYSQRADEKRIRAFNENLLAIRPKVDAAVNKILGAINALYLVNETIEKDAAKEAEISAVIDAVNAEIIQFTETLSRRGIGRKVKAKPDDKPVITDPDPTPDPTPTPPDDDRPVIE